MALASVPIGMDERTLVAGFFSAYHLLSKEDTLKLNKELAIVEPEPMREKAIRLTNPFIELGKAEGLDRGRHEGETAVVIRLLSRRVGGLSTAQKNLIRRLTLPKLEALADSLLDFKSRADLTRWLKQNAS